MTYRSETTGMELHRIMHEEAKATLEELAGKDYIDLPHIESTLQTMGFQKEAEIRQYHMGPIMMYRRETDKGIELLVDRDLAKIDDKTPHLYRLPAGQDVEEWCESIPDYITKKEDKAKYIGYFGGVTIASAIFANILPYLIDLPIVAIAEYGLLVIGITTLPGAVGINKLLMRKGPLGKELVAKGPKALHYIADTKYEAPRLRVETKLRIVDAEFIDRQAELEMLAVEQPAEVRRLTKK
ncbi:MAG: hypothetical protein AABX24_05440 [Nanoarchaeota archaeon]